MRLIYTSRFARVYKKLPSHIKKTAQEKVDIFVTNHHGPQLKTHKLHGKFSDFWSFAITSSYRLVFEFGPDGTVYFHDIGDHSVYQ